MVAGVVVVAMAVARVEVAEVIHLEKMEQEALETKATLSVSSVTKLGIMQIGVQKPRSKMRHTMLVQMRAWSHKALMLAETEKWFQEATGRVCFYMRKKCCLNCI